MLEGSTPAEMSAALQGRVLRAVRRKGKYFWLELDSPGPWPLLHFGMTGAIAVEGVGGAKYVR